LVAGFEGTEEGIMEVALMIQATGATVPAMISFIVFNMTTIPCFAAVAAAKGELGSKKKFAFTLLFWIAVSYVVSMMIYLIGSWWWTLFIFVAIWAVVITLIILWNKGKLNLKPIISFAKKIFKKKIKSGGCCDCSHCSMKDHCSSSKK
jgi:hypothetical protein